MLTLQYAMTYSSEDLVVQFNQDAAIQKQYKKRTGKNI